MKVASLSPEAQATAHKVGLADNRTALLETAAQPYDKQAAYLEARAKSAGAPMKFAPEPLDDFEVEEKQLSKGISWWNSIRESTRQKFLRRIGY